MYKAVKANNHEEAIEKSGWREGQLVRIKRLVANGNTDGNWTVHAEVEEIQEIRKPYEPDRASPILPSASSNQA